MGAYVAVGVALVGAAISAYGEVQQGNAAAKNASFQSQVAANNATIAKQNADYATKAGEANAMQTSLKGGAQLGAIRAAQAANNVDVNSGSASDVQTSQKEISSLSTADTMQQALLSAYGYNAQSTNFTAQSNLDAIEGPQAREGADIGATGSFLETAGKSWAGAAGGGGPGAGGGEGGSWQVG